MPDDVIYITVTLKLNLVPIYGAKCLGIVT